MGKISDTSKYASVTPASADSVIGTDAGSSNATKTFTMANITSHVAANVGSDLIISSSAPSTPSSTGTAGQIAFDGTKLYICVATNSWRKVDTSASF